jgi:hypothetical protein
MREYKIKTPKSWSATQNDLAAEFENWGVSNWDTNYPRGARLEGMNQAEADRTVTLTYQKDGKTVSLMMNKQSRAVDNLRVLFLAIESMRMNERRGIGEVLQSAYAQLQAPEVFNPYEVLGVYDNQPMEVIEAAFKAKARTAHPDTATGSEEKMLELNKAIEIIRKEKNVER